MTQERLADVTDSEPFPIREGLRYFIAQRLCDILTEKLPVQVFDRLRDCIAQKIDESIDHEIHEQLRALQAAN